MNQRRRVFIALAVLSTASAAWAQTWNGGTGSWSDPTMWSTNTVPGTFSGVSIDGGNPVNSVVTRGASDGGSPSNAITIDAGDTLITTSYTSNSATVNGKLIMTGNATLGLNSPTTLQGTGEIDFDSPGGIFVFPSGFTAIPAGLTIRGPFTQNLGSTTDGHTLDNHGSIIVTGSGNTVDYGDDDFASSTNTGTITATGGANLTLRGIVNAVAGSVSITGGGTLSILPLPLNNVTMTNNGSVSATDSSVMIGSGTGFEQSPTLGGFHLTRSSVTNVTSSILGLASVTGDVSITGNAASVAGAHFAMALAAPGSADILSITGPLNLTANDFLDLSSLPGTLLNTPYVLVTSSAITGTFDNVTPGYSVIYTPTSVIVTAVPEPVSLFMLTALAAPLLSRRRRW